MLRPSMYLRRTAPLKIRPCEALFSATSSFTQTPSELDRDPPSGRARFFSSRDKSTSHRRQLARGDAERLRKMREDAKGDKKRPSSGAATGRNVVDYRLRGNGSHAGSSISVSSLWGEATKAKEVEPKRPTLGELSKMKKEGQFVSFFDEVDALVEEKHGYSRPQPKQSLLDILGADDPSTTKNMSVSSSTSAEYKFHQPDPKPHSSLAGSPLSISSSVGSSRKSVFDVLPASVAAQPHNENAYERDSYEQYQLLLQDAVARMQNRKGLDDEVIAWLMKNERVLPSELPILDQVIKSGGAMSAMDAAGSGDRPESGALREQVQLQRARFLEAVPFTPAQLDQARTALKFIADLCAKRARAAPIEIAWMKIKEAGIVPSEKSMDTYLYVVSTGGLSSSISAPLDSYLLSRNSLSDQKSGSILDALMPLGGHSKPTLSDDDKERLSEKRDIKEEVAVFRDMLYEWNERSISVRTNSLISKGQPEAAESLLDAFKSSDGELRLRTFMPVLKHYCEQGDVASALSLFKRMRAIPTVYLEPETYVLVISTVAEKGFFRVGAEPIEGAQKIGYAPSSGPELFDALVSEMAEDALEITSASARRMSNAFAVGFKGDAMAKNLKEMHSLAGIPPCNDAALDTELVASRVTVSAETAECPRTGATLRLILLGEAQRSTLHDSLLDLSKAAIEQLQPSRVPRRGGSLSDSEYAARELSRFSTWLDKRTDPPFTAIIDGANIAYYMQNFDQGRFNYHQIQFVVDALLSMNENPLVIIPHKYTTTSFSVTTGLGRGFQRLREKDIAILERLKKEGRVWGVPRRCHDDYYWMLASVSDQTASRRNVDLGVLPDNNDGRWPGTRPMLVSNDQMRDHKLELMEPRLYRRWHSCHIVNYNFTAFVDDECVDREIGFSTPDFFSREIQGNPSPAKNNGSGEKGTAWHFPVSDWDLNDRFCVRIPRQYG